MLALESEADCQLSILRVLAFVLSFGGGVTVAIAC